MSEKERFDELEIAVICWRDARRAFFEAENASKLAPYVWTRLANAEHALMKLAGDIV